MIDEHLILYGIVALLWAEFVWQLILALRQHYIYVNSVTVPNELKDYISGSAYEKARLYSIDNNKFEIMTSLISALENTALVLFNGNVYFWMQAEGLVNFLGFEDNELLQSAVFVFIFFTYCYVTFLPHSIYYNFVLEKKYGLNKQTAGVYIIDVLKSFIICQLMLISLTRVMVYILQEGGDYCFVYFWLFVTPMNLLILTPCPDYIAPLFDTYTPLPDGELKTRIEQLASSVNFPLCNVYVVKNSWRTVHSNVYLFGFFKNKRIFLFDMLLKDFSSRKITENGNKGPTEETKSCYIEDILAILGHELGHWKFNHEIKNTIILQMRFQLSFVVFSYLFKLKELYRAFGFYNKQPIVIGMHLCLTIIVTIPYSLLSFGLSFLRRKFEFQADDFVRSLGKAFYLRRALIKTNNNRNQDKLEFPVYDWLYSMWHHSDPPLLERLKALDKTE